MGVVNIPDSLIARETDCGVYLNVGREFAVASTKSFTSQCIVLSLIGIWFSQNQNTHTKFRYQKIKDLQNLHFQINEIIKNTKSKIANILDYFTNQSKRSK